MGKKSADQKKQAMDYADKNRMSPDDAMSKTMGASKK
jgi:hypothetical protein